MTPDDLATAIRSFNRRVPFRPYLIEFVAGEPLLVTHPETVSRVGDLFHHRAADRRDCVFAAAQVLRLIDPPPGG